MTPEEIKTYMEIIFQILMFLIPIAAAVLTWFLRNYVKSAQAEKTMGAIVRLSNSAINYAEDLDKRGELDKYLKLWNMPDDVINLTSDGLKKLNLAGSWLEAELKKNGIEMSDEEAKAWIASQFQNQVGDLGRERTVTERSKDAVSLLQALARSGLIHLPADPVQANQLADQVASWAVAQEKKEPGAQLHEDAVTRVRSQLSAPVGPEARLADLARQSMRYVEQLKASHELTLPEMDIAVAWVLTEVTKQGISVTANQIASAVHAAFEEAKTG